MSIIETYVVAIVHVGWLIAVAYWLFYRRSPWRTHDTGPALMWKARAFAALFTVVILGFWWPFPGYEYIYSATVTLVVGSMAYQLCVLRRLQRGPDRDF